MIPKNDNSSNNVIGPRKILEIPLSHIKKFLLESRADDIADPLEAEEAENFQEGRHRTLHAKLRRITFNE